MIAAVALGVSSTALAASLALGGGALVIVGAALLALVAEPAPSDPPLEVGGGLRREPMAEVREAHERLARDLAGTAVELARLAERLEGNDASDLAAALRRSAIGARDTAGALRRLEAGVVETDGRSLLAHAVRSLTVPLRDRGIEVEVSARLVTPPQPGEQQILYRAAREALRDVAQRPGPRRVQVELATGLYGARVCVVDPAGPVAGAPDDGLPGLDILRGQVAARGGALRVERDPCTGTRLVVDLPTTPGARRSG